MSSLDVYGAPQQIPIAEDHPLVESAGSYDQGDLTGYAYGKVLCERMLAVKAAVQGRGDYASLRAPHNGDRTPRRGGGWSTRGWKRESR